MPQCQELPCRCHRNILSMEVSIYIKKYDFHFGAVQLERGDLLWSASVRIRNLPSSFHRTVFTCFTGKSFSADTVGPMATITDSLFSLIIFIYVMVTFLYLFYGFCWIDAPKKTEADLEEENKLVRDSLWRIIRLY